MSCSRLLLSLGLSATLVACTSGDPPGGQIGNNTTLTPGVVTPSPPLTPGTIGTPTNPTSPGTTGCSLRDRQDWAAAQIREWYLFPETLPSGLIPGSYSTLQDYLDALTANARAQGRDRYFTYVTSIAEEDAYYESGATAAFGMRVQIADGTSRVYIADAYEGAAAVAAGLDRGDEIVAIGSSEATLQSVASIVASEGEYGVTLALGPPDVGVSRTLRVRNGGGERVVTLTKTEFGILPVSTRYGTRVFEQDGLLIGYLNLRTFISTADPALRRAFAEFKARGVRHLIIDFRYNGGGMVDIAELMGDLMGEARLATDVFQHTRFRSSKSNEDVTKVFERKPESMAPMKIAFITTGDTASASESVVNGMLPWLRDNITLVGANTYGKPVGQIGLDRTACDDRLRLIAFSVRNADNQGDYYQGLASSVPNSCAAADDLQHQMGDPAETSTRVAIDALAGRACTPITGVSTARSLGTGRERRSMLVPSRPDIAQRDVPGTF